MHRALRVAPIVCVLSACGGSGGEIDPTGGITITFDRPAVEVCATPDAPATVRLTATLSAVPEDVVGAYVVVAGEGFETGSFRVARTGANAFALEATPRAALAGGQYTGTLSVAVCRDAACTRRYEPSGRIVPYTVNVAAPLALSVSMDGGPARATGTYDVLGVTSGQTVTVTSTSPVTWQTGLGWGATQVRPGAVTAMAWSGTITGEDGSAVGLRASPLCGGGSAAVRLSLPVSATFGRAARSTRQVQYSAGPDGQVRTDDDVITSYSEGMFYVDGDTRISTSYASAGADRAWFTPDDVCGGTWQARGLNLGSNQNGPGSDRIWGTADDLVWGWEQYDTLVEGNVHQNALFEGPGTDGVWFTEDDSSVGAIHRTLDASGAEVMRVRYDAAGQVMRDWFGAKFTARYPEHHTRWESWDRQVRYGVDDRPTQCLTHEFADADSQYWTEETQALPGEDGVCFTPDDGVYGYRRASNVYW